MFLIAIVFVLGVILNDYITLWGILQVWEAQNYKDQTKSGSTRLLLICLAMLAWLPECHLRSLSKSVGNLPTWHEGSHAGPNVMIIDSTYM